MFWKKKKGGEVSSEASTDDTTTVTEEAIETASETNENGAMEHVARSGPNYCLGA